MNLMGRCVNRLLCNRFLKIKKGVLHTLFLTVNLKGKNYGFK